MNPLPERPLLVALGPEATALRLIHRAFWMARETGRPWMAVHVAVGGKEDAEEDDQARLWLQEAERLGGHARWVEARTIAGGLQEVARTIGASDLVVGKTQGHWPWVRLGHALAQELQRRCQDLRITVVPLESEVRHPLRLPRGPEWVGAAAASLMVLGACTGVGWILPPEQPLPAIFLLYLLGTALVAQRYGLLFGAGAVAASAFAFDLVFDSRPGSLTVGNWPMMALFLAILAMGQYAVALSERLRDQARALRRREALMASMLLLGTQLARATDRSQVEATLAQVAPRLLHRPVEVRLEAPEPLRVAGPPLAPHQEDLREAMGAQVALALERLEAEAALQKAQLAQETERIRSGLLEAIGHDLRTPLAAIQGAASSLLLRPVDPQARDLLTMVCGEAERLGTLLGNLLDLTRLESLSEVPNQDWIALEEVVDCALRRAGADPGRVQVELPESLPLVRADGVLLEQLVLNLLVNAQRHAPEGPVLLRLRALPEALRLEVEDRGPGIPDELKLRVFDKFFRLPRRGSDGGVGLGLAICEAVVRLHGGRIWVEDVPSGGARFCADLPRCEAPSVPEEAP